MCWFIYSINIIINVRVDRNGAKTTRETANVDRDDLNEIALTSEDGIRMCVSRTISNNKTEFLMGHS